MNRILFDFGFIQIHWYSITMFVAILIGGFIVLKEAKKHNIPEKFTIDLFYYMIPIAFIGARLYYVLFNLDYYIQNPISIFKIWEGGLAIHGAMIAGFIVLIYYTKKHNIKPVKMLDYIVLGLIIGQAIGRWGNFFNSEAYGGITTLEHLKNLHIPNFIIEGMFINGAYHQPAFLYESLWCILGFIFLFFMRKYKYLKIGQLSCLYLMWYGIGRFVIEGMRTDSLMLGAFKMAEIVSLALILIGLIAVLILNRGTKFGNLYNGDDKNEQI